MKNIVVKKLGCTTLDTYINYSSGYFFPVAKVQRAYAVTGGSFKSLVSFYKGLCYGKEEWFFGEVFLEKLWKLSLRNDCGWGHGTVIHLLGATAWERSPTAALPVCKSSGRLGMWNSSMYYNLFAPLIGSTTIPSLAELSEVLQRSSSRIRS